MVWRSKKDALDRVQKLKTEHPDDPEVEKLFQRTKAALMKSKGDYTDVAESWTAYKRAESELVKTISNEGDKLWDQILSEHPGYIENAFPSPDTKTVTLESLQDKYIILKDVLYPENQFYGASGEYIWHGKPSSGYYFVNIGSRAWLGPYEAIKRFKRAADSGLNDHTKYTILGKIVSITAEIPAAGESTVGTFRDGWVIEPVAVKVPGHVTAIYDSNAESSGRYAGEEMVSKIKDSWYTVKSVPKDASPEKVMEIFMTAIKEKNFDLYLDCINPEY